jgi:hypothetical protein
MVVGVTKSLHLHKGAIREPFNKRETRLIFSCVNMMLASRLELIIMMLLKLVLKENRHLHTK